MSQVIPTDPWRYRRRFMLAVCGFCMWVVSYIIVFDKTGGAAETAVSMGFMTLASSLAAYVFGAAWETVKAPETRAARYGGYVPPAYAQPYPVQQQAMPPVTPTSGEREGHE